MKGLVWGVCILAIGFSTAVAASAEAASQGSPPIQTDDQLLKSLKESDPSAAPVDYGPGPGRPKRAATAEALVVPMGAPVGGATVGVKGAFGDAVNWPIIPIHVVLLPDGRVMSYGSTDTGKQGGQLVYDVWNPKLGSGANAHMLLPNGLRTDIFCSGQSILTATGEVLMTGGDRTINGQRNYSIPDTTIFSPTTESLRAAPPMAYARWYPTIIPLANNDKLILGGREDFIPQTAPQQDIAFPARTPEVYQTATGTWRTLSNASSDVAFGKTGWYYPRAFPTTSGKVFVLVRTGKMFYLDPNGAGILTKINKTTLAGGAELPVVMFEPGKVLSLRLDAKNIVVDLNGPSPVVTQTADLDQLRKWSNATLLADGRVFVNGGSSAGNTLTGSTNGTQIWNPASGQWTPGPDATKPRLYHSTALLLPDGTVLTGGGGAPGPVKNLNAEIYYPSYLYKQDGSGQLAERPVIGSAPASVIRGQAFLATMTTAGTVSRVTLLRMGSVTHSFNAEQRFFNLAFTQSGQQLTITPPADANIALPGYYMLFAFDASGAPSEAKILWISA